MRDRIILITKDATGKFYLPIYGNKVWNTPNIEELASKGTVFQRHYTAAPSSAMAYTSMFSGKYPFETERKDYRVVVGENLGETLFDKAEKMGYECHVIWDEVWMTTAKVHSECYGNAKIHAIKDFQQCVGAHYPHKGELLPDPRKTEEAFGKMMTTIEEIVSTKKKVFVWIHFPHVIYGRTCYGGDMDLWDKAIGMLRKYFPDDGIYISADHGNMNGTKGKICYGFDVNEAASSVPMISPRINGMTTVDYPTCHTDLYSIIFEQNIHKHEFVYSDSAYYAQPNRKLAIMYGKYKYIYSNKGKKEELYDLEYDPHEDVNLMTDYIFDIDRKLQTPLKEVYLYQGWEQLPEIREKMRKERIRVWREASFADKVEGYSMTLAKNVYKKIRLVIRKIRAK